MTRPTLGLFLLWLLLGCQSNTPEFPTLAPTVALQTPAPVMSLPPTWTAIPTLTPSITPTLTPSSAPTETPSPTVTLAASRICDQFSLTSKPREGAELDYFSVLNFGWEGAPPDSLVILSLVDVAGTETLSQFPVEARFISQFALDPLRRWGTYTWQISLYIAPYGEICPQEGRFFRRAWWLKPLRNPFNPPFAVE